MLHFSDMSLIVILLIGFSDNKSLNAYAIAILVVYLLIQITPLDIIDGKKFFQDELQQFNNIPIIPFKNKCFGSTLKNI